MFQRLSESERGFTIVELMIALFISTIMLIGISVVVTASHSYLSSGRQRMNLQQDLSLVREVVGNRIRQSVCEATRIYTDYTAYTNGGAAQISGSCVRLCSPFGDSVLIYMEGNSLKISENNAVYTVLQEGLDTLVFVDSNEALQTWVGLSSGPWAVTDTLTDAYRICGLLEWPYALFANKKIKFDSGSGIITGKLHANIDIAPVPPGYTVDGDMTEVAPNVPLPTVDWNYFKNVAIASGQYVIGDKTFDANGSPYTGVWYITKKAKLKANAVINGTIVTVKDVEFKGNNITIKAPPGYPALLVGKKFKAGSGGVTNITLHGFVYCSDKWDAKGSNWTVIGAIVAVKDIRLRVTGTSMTYAADKLYGLNGITFN